MTQQRPEASITRNLAIQTPRLLYAATDQLEYGIYAGYLGVSTHDNPVPAANSRCYSSNDIEASSMRLNPKPYVCTSTLRNTHSAWRDALLGFWAVAGITCKQRRWLKWLPSRHADQGGNGVLSWGPNLVVFLIPVGNRRRDLFMADGGMSSCRCRQNQTRYTRVLVSLKVPVRGTDSAFKLIMVSELY